MSAYTTRESRRLSFAPGSPAAKRHEASARKLAAAVDAFVERYMLGDHEPHLAMAEQLGVKPTTTRSWIFRARRAGMQTSLEGHLPRRTYWDRADSWVACVKCRAEWPCAPVVAWHAKRGAPNA